MAGATPASYGVFTPASMSIVPDTLDSEDLRAGNGLMMASLQGANLVGSVLGTEIVSKKESLAREHVFARGKTSSFLTPGECVTRSVLTCAHDLKKGVLRGVWINYRYMRKDSLTYPSDFDPRG